MQQRTKRMAIIWAKTIATFVIFSVAAAGFIFGLSLLPDVASIAVLALLAVIGLGFVTFNIAKLRLESEERDQRRILHSLSKSYDE